MLKCNDKIHHVIQKIKNYVIHFVKLQIIVTAAALPVLICWGLPISIMSIVGNFIFTPILTVFLTLSSMIFITELLSIPNGLLISALSSTVTLWESSLQFGKKSWLVGFAQPSKIFVVLALILATLLVMRLIFNIISKAVLVVLFITGASVFYNYFKWPTQIKAEYVPHTSKKLVISQLPNKRINITDNGLFNEKQSAEKFVAFELKPYLIKKYGTKTIEKIVLNKPSVRSFKAVDELCNTFTIKTIEIPYFEKSLSKYGWQCFFSLKNKLENDGTEWKRTESQLKQALYDITN